MHLDVWFTIPDMKDGKREILQIFIIQKDSTLKLFTKIIKNRNILQYFTLHPPLDNFTILHHNVTHNINL